MYVSNIALQEAIFDRIYCIKVFIVEVNYSKQDIAITEAHCKRGEIPAEKDNTRGFTSNFNTYKEAERYARKTAAELKFSF